MVLKLPLLTHESRYLPKAWRYTEEPQRIRKRPWTYYIQIITTFHSWTLTVPASPGNFWWLKTLFVLSTPSKFDRQILSCWEFIGLLPHLHETFCLKHYCLVEVSSHACDSSICSFWSSPAPWSTCACFADGGGLPYANAVAIFNSQWKASKKASMQDFLPYGGIVVWPFL